MSKLEIKIEGDEYDALCRDLVDMALETRNLENIHTLLRILQLLLYGKWKKGGD